jgi:hypothetical protein
MKNYLLSHLHQERVGDGHQGTIDIMVSKMNREKSIYFQTSKSLMIKLGR